MNFQEAEDIRDGESRIIDCEEMRMIRFEGGDETRISQAGLAGVGLAMPRGL